MPQNFLSCDREQSFLMPPSLRDWLPADHLAWFVLESVGQLDLDPEYPRLRHLRHRPRRVAIQRRPPRLPDGRCKPAASLRHVPGFPRRRLLRRLRPEPGPSADTALCPEGRSGSVPTFTVVRSAGSAPSFSPAVPVVTVTQHPSRTSDGTKCSPPEARNPRDRRVPAHRFGSPYPSGWSCVEP
jgi:hypothetical protein